MGSLVIDVTPELEERLREQAAERGMEIGDYVRSALESLTPFIVRDPERCAGDPALAGTRTAVHDVISYAKRFNWDVERIRDEALPHLSKAQIRAAVEWYHAHTEEIEEILHRCQDFYEQGLARTRASR
jgi:uncharacterized protein (DUF433 family)